MYWIHKKTRTYISKDDTIEIDQVHNRLDNGQPRYVVTKGIDGNRHIYTLNVTRLERRDAGNYTCQITIRGGSTARNPSLDGEIIVLGEIIPRIYSGLILGLRPANERRRYFVTTSLIGWAQTLNQPCILWLPD